MMMRENAMNKVLSLHSIKNIYKCNFFFITFFQLINKYLIIFIFISTHYSKTHHSTHQSLNSSLINSSIT